MKKSLSIFLIIVFFLSACSYIKKTERKARRDPNYIYCVVSYYHNRYYEESMTKEYSDKIIYWSKEGVAKDTSQKAYYLNILGSFLNDKKEAYACFAEAARLGNTESEWIQGLNYMEGRTVAINNDSAFYWFSLAAEDYSYAASEIAEMYLDGRLGKKDTVTAIHYYKKACMCYERSSGDERACDFVANYYLKRDSLESSLYSDKAKVLSKYMRYR